MRIEIYKTFEINDQLWKEITNGFNESFGKSLNDNSLKNSFCTSNSLGYAFHAVAFSDDNNVVGFNTYSPTFYNDNLNVLVSGSTYVKKEYRKDIFIFYDMISALRKKGKEEGFHVTVGVPNSNSKDYAIKFLKAIYIGDLDYYILPLKISSCFNKPFIRPLDFLCKPFLLSHLYLQLFLSKHFNSKEKAVKYMMLSDKEHLKQRFKNPHYKLYTEKNISAYYRIIIENHTRTAYLMDFRQSEIRTKYALAKAVKYIVDTERPDAILFVGFLHLQQTILFKVPKRFIPKPLPMTYYILDKANKEKYSDMNDASNWNFSLMNFDAR